jgi:Uma2 family endonuclease
MTANPNFSEENYFEICERYGNFYEYNNGAIISRFNQKVLPTDLVDKMLLPSYSEGLLYAEPNIETILGMATRTHGTIINNISFLLNLALENLPYRIYQQAPNVFVQSKTRVFRIPDVLVVGLPELTDHRDYLLNPLLIIEVLSDSTQKTDKTDKLEEYCSIETLEDYVLIAQDKVLIEHFSRNQNTNEWFCKTYTQEDEFLYLLILKCALTIKKIYRNVEM